VSITPNWVSKDLILQAMSLKYSHSHLLFSPLKRYTPFPLMLSGKKKTQERSASEIQGKYKEYSVAKRTPFYDLHLAASAKIVDFAGWDMPLHYGSQLQEHHQVRQHAGMFDVSHMGVVDLQGEQASEYLRRLLANNVDRLIPGKALYTCMLNEDGGVIDDLIVYKVDDDHYRIVINAGTREKDLAWMRKQAQPFKAQLIERSDLAMLAIQGPEIKERIAELLPMLSTKQASGQASGQASPQASQQVSDMACNQASDPVEVLRNLKPFHFAAFNDWFIARTGYTGEDGYEIIFPGAEAAKLWQACISAGIAPCGLGARDTLRLEAGLNLYGSDMDESVTPLESNLAWTVIFDPKDREFIGREALEKQAQQGLKYRLVGLVLEGPGVIRNHQKVIIQGHGEGEVTSGGYSPTLEKSIALARIPVDSGNSDNNSSDKNSSHNNSSNSNSNSNSSSNNDSNNNSNNCFVEIRNKQVPAQVVKPPFVRNGKRVF
jgi:aminomethyltransferase